MISHQVPLTVSSPCLSCAPPAAFSALWLMWLCGAGLALDPNNTTMKQGMDNAQAKLTSVAAGPPDLSSMMTDPNVQAPTALIMPPPPCSLSVVSCQAIPPAIKAPHVTRICLDCMHCMPSTTFVLVWPCLVSMRCGSLCLDVELSQNLMGSLGSNPNVAAMMQNPAMQQM